MYQFEPHFHTSEVSACGKTPAAVGAKAYRDIGHCGIMTADHFANVTFRVANLTDADWNTKLNFYLTGYNAAKEFETDDFKVLLGLELRFFNNINDYLIFGMTEEILRKYNNADNNFIDMGIENFRKLADEHGIKIFQAHPFRNTMVITDPKLLDGIEIYNCCNRNDSRNEIAAIWADKFNLARSSGSDYHRVEDLARGGLYTEKPIRNHKDLIDALMNGCELKNTITIYK